MTRPERLKAEQMLRDIWDALDQAPIPAAELKAMSDAQVGYLLRFWNHKRQHWAKEGDDEALARQPAFTEEPPQGYTAMRTAKPPADKPAPRRIHRRRLPGRTFGR